MAITPLPTPVPSRADPTNFAARADAFLGALPTFGDEANALAVEVNGYAVAADADATAAAASASAAATSASNALTSANNAATSASSALNAPGTNATSTTSLTVGTGSKSLTIQTGKAYTVGQFLILANTPTPSNYMQGQITAYDSGTGALTVDVTNTGGSGTFTDWTIALTAIVAAGVQVASFSAGTTGFTPSTATTGTVTLGGTLNVANGGTGATTATNARTNLSAAKSGINSDITELTGLTTALTVEQGGTGNSSYAIGDLLFASSSTVLSKLADVATGNVLLSGGIGVAPAYGKVGLTTHVSGILPVANGGSGTSSSTGTGSNVLSNTPTLSTPAISGATYNTAASVTAGTNAQGQGALTADYNVISSTPNSPSGVTLPSASVGRRVVVVNRGINSITVYPASGSAIDALANNAAVTLAVNSYAEFHADTTTHWNSTLRLATDNVASGVTTFSAGTTGFTPSTATNGAVTLAGTLNAVNGGTGLTSYTAGDLIVASTSTTLTKISDIATGNVLLSGGVGNAPSYGKVGLSTHISGTLGVTNGGTGLATIPANSILVANSADTLTTVTPTGGQSIRRNAGNTAWEAYTPSAGGVTITELAIFSSAAVAATPVSNSENIAFNRTFATGLTSGVLRSHNYNNSLFLLTTDTSTNNIATSSDGETWTLRTMTASGLWRLGTFGTNVLGVVNGKSTVNISTNGTSYSAATSLPGNASNSYTGAISSSTYLVYFSGTTAYLTTNHGTSWSTETLPASFGVGSAGGFYVVNGKFFYIASVTTAYWSSTGTTGSWSSVSLPVTVTNVWFSNGIVYFSAGGAGAQVYKMDTESTYSALSGITTPFHASSINLVEGVYCTFNTTYGNSVTFHANGSIVRSSSVSVSTAGITSAKIGTTYVLSNSSSNVLTITAASSQTAYFKV